MKISTAILTTMLVLGLGYYVSKDVAPDSTVAPTFESPTVIDSPAVPTVTESPLLTKKAIRELKIDPKRTIFIYGEINNNIDSATQALLKLGSSPEPIYVLINSPGGSVINGSAFVSAMEASKGPVYTVCMRLCASMGFIIHQYGKERLAIDRSILMSHPASYGGIFVSDLDRITARMAMLGRFVDKSNAYIAKRSGMSFDEFKLLSSRELWLDAEDSVNMRLADGLVYVRPDTLIAEPQLSAEDKASIAKLIEGVK